MDFTSPRARSCTGSVRSDDPFGQPPTDVRMGDAVLEPTGMPSGWLPGRRASSSIRQDRRVDFDAWL